MTLNRRIEILGQLGYVLNTDEEGLEKAINQAYIENRWFTKESSKNAIKSIASEFLDKGNLKQWTSAYDISNQFSDTKVGLVLAGNIPLVGFHDVMCVFLSGHRSIIKLSSKDTALFTYVIDNLYRIDPKVKEYIVTAERLSGFDAVIATGSNNSGRYFDAYFGKYPHIIRKNRNAIGILNGSETKEDFIALGKDIFTYFGLGCRNVSKIYVPEGYKFDDFLGALHDEYKEIVHHNKYKNNFDHNNALFLLNKVKFLMNGCLIIREDEQIASRIACLHYEYFDDESTLINTLQEKSEAIQCVVSKDKLKGIDTFGFGEAQTPSLSDYADGIDTMKFLTQLS